jgi:hypothetical protein
MAVFEDAIAHLGRDATQASRDLAAARASTGYSSTAFDKYIAVANTIQDCLDQRQVIVARRRAKTEAARKELAAAQGASRVPIGPYYRHLLQSKRDVTDTIWETSRPVYVTLVPVPKASVGKPVPTPEKKGSIPKAAKANVAQEVIDMSDFKFKTLEQCTSMKRAAATYMSKDEILNVIQNKPHLVKRMPKGYAKATKEQLCQALFKM